MADNEEGEGAASPRHDQGEGEEVASRGNGWEVVSLTASAYAAAPGPKEVKPIHKEKDDATDKSEAESSRALIMSGHFVFPPSQHENLPIEQEYMETHKEDESGVDMVKEMPEEEGGRSQQKGEEIFSIPGLNITEALPSEQVLDGKGDRLSIQDPRFDGAAVLQGLNIANKEQDVYNTYDNSAVTGDPIKPSESSLDPSSDVSQSPESGKEDKDDGSGSEFSSGAWWKKQVACFCAHAKETNAFWSIFVAAAVMGLVILGQRWQQERWQVLQERWQHSLNNEKSGKVVGSLSRFKDILVGGGRRASYISNRAAADR